MYTQLRGSVMRYLKGKCYTTPRTVWSLATVNNINTIRILQKKCISIINHAPFNSHTNNLFEENKVLKLDDIIKFEQLKRVFLFKNGDLPKELNTLFKLNINTYNTWNASKGVSAFQRLIQLLLPLDHLGILLLLHGMNVSNQLMTLRISTYQSINQLKKFMKKLYTYSYKCK